MDRDTDTLSLIRNSFPGRDALIQRALRDVESFRALCEDYRECSAALERWEQRNGDEAVRRREEYTQLLAELDEDVRTWLEALAAGSAAFQERKTPS